VKLFSCQACQNIVYFENRSCGRCGHRLAFLPERLEISALKPEGQDWEPLAKPGTRRRFCANAATDACNWLIESDSDDIYCRACRHNRTIPDLSSPERLRAWRELEAAKRRLFYSLLRWSLPLGTREDDPAHGLQFNFLADGPQDEDQVMTGHEHGVITIALTEADDIERERRRLQMNEPYRTLLGHFRHETGHHYWDLLVRDDADRLEECRALFGDDGQDYQAMLKKHYAEGPPDGWQDAFVSAYATVHPWEDFAETWAHYLHIVDTLEMASEFGIEVHPRGDSEGGLSARVDFDPYSVEDFDRIAQAWLPCVFALNSMSRAMGVRDLYPFTLSTVVIRKLAFIHGLVHGHRPKVMELPARWAVDTSRHYEGGSHGLESRRGKLEGDEGQGQGTMGQAH
jgi:hypothetical protein